MGRTATGDRSEWLDAKGLERFRARVCAALKRARATGRPVLASETAQLRRPAEPVEVILASRTQDEPWFCLEQPDREGTVLAALGSVHEIGATGPERFAQTAGAWRELVADAVAAPADAFPSAGLCAVGGFAFSPGGGSSPGWRGYPPASLIVPEVSLAHRGHQTWLTVNAMVNPDDMAADVSERLERRLAGLSSAALPLIDPAATGEFRVSSPMAPSHYEEAVARAVERIRHHELEKVVLAREVEVMAPAHHDPAAILGVLRHGFPSCFVYAVGRGDATFLGASPELLVRRQGQRASTVALAGSARRSADPAVDDHLGERLLHSAKDRHENAIVARRIAQQLGRHSVWVTMAPEPVLIRVANIQHLATPIRAQLARPMSAIELAGLLHPTPAVGGEPWAVAETLIPALEGFDRGWYAGPVGWTDGTGDGEFCVALRCALLRGQRAVCYAGCGIVADSDPAAELAETEVKLQALLPVLAG